MKQIFIKYLARLNSTLQLIEYYRAKGKTEAAEEESIKSEAYKDFIWDLKDKFGIVINHQPVKSEIPADSIKYEYEEFFVVNWGDEI